MYNKYIANDTEDWSNDYPISEIYIAGNTFTVSVMKVQVLDEGKPSESQGPISLRHPITYDYQTESSNSPDTTTTSTPF